jgi:hypothetical protein
MRKMRGGAAPRSRRRRGWPRWRRQSKLKILGLWVGGARRRRRRRLPEKGRIEESPETVSGGGGGDSPVAETEHREEE